MRRVRAHTKALVAQLARAGFPAAREEVRAMVEASPDDPAVWQCWVDRRSAGEPLEWILGFTVFTGHRVRVDPGVYVPRPQTEIIARRAIEALPEDGAAADLCTGCGAIAHALLQARPGARVVATDIDSGACRCAESNGVETYQGHLADPLPEDLSGHLDVVAAVVPYVPSDELLFLPRDVRTYEPPVALDGGIQGIELLTPAVEAAARLLRSGGTVVVELGARQDEHLRPALDAAGFDSVERLVDEEGDLRGICARFAG